MAHLYKGRLATDEEIDHLLRFEATASQFGDAYRISTGYYDKFLPRKPVIVPCAYCKTTTSAQIAVHLNRKIENDSKRHNRRSTSSKQSAKHLV